MVLAFHINRGSYGKTDLSGLNAVQAFTTPGPMAQGGGTGGVYVDSAPTPNSAPHSKSSSEEKPVDRRACWRR